MIKKTIDKKNSEMRITVDIPKDEWKSSQTKAFTLLAKNLSLKGFRKGKVPLTKAKDFIPASSIWEKAIMSLLDKYVVIASKEINQDEEIILDSPTYTVEKVSNDELEIIFIYPLFPELKLKDYKKYNINLAKKTDKEIIEDVKEQENRLLSNVSVLIPKTGENAVIEKNDTIIFDFEGFVDSKSFEGGKATNFELKVGSGGFIPGFEDQLIGLKLGHEGSINVAFPKDYHVKDLANKEAEFKIVIKEIKVLDIPEMDEEFIKTLNLKDVKTPQELNKYLLDLTKKENQEKARIAFKNEIFSKMIEDNEIPIPKTLVFKELQNLLKRFEENLKKEGFNKKEYFEMTKLTNEDVTKELTEEAEKNIKISLLFAHLAKTEKLEAQEKDFESQYEKLAKLYNIDDLKMVKKMLPKEKLEPQIVNDLVLDMLIKYNNKK